jgi:hypothetical protein
VQLSNNNRILSDSNKKLHHMVVTYLGINRVQKYLSLVTLESVFKDSVVLNLMS